MLELKRPLDFEGIIREAQIVFKVVEKIKEEADCRRRCLDAVETMIERGYPTMAYSRIAQVARLHEYRVYETLGKYTELARIVEQYQKLFLEKNIS